MNPSQPKPQPGPPSPSPPPVPPPAPPPVCDGPNCGGVFLDSQSLEEITCPCGYGYYDEDKHMFISGKLVRDGKAPTRQEYVEHVRRCEHREEGRPILGSIYLGASKLGRGKSTLGARRGSSARDTSQAAALNASKHHDLSQLTQTTQNAHQHHHDAVSADSCLVPKDGVERDSLDFYIKTFLNPSAKIYSCDDYWEIIGVEPLSDADLKDVKKDSRDWKKEAIHPSSVGVTYETSRTKEARERERARLSRSSTDKGATDRHSNSSPNAKTLNLGLGDDSATKSAYSEPRNSLFTLPSERLSPQPDRRYEEESDTDIHGAYIAKPKETAAAKGKSRHDNSDPRNDRQSHGLTSHSKRSAPHNSRRTEDDTRRSK